VADEESGNKVAVSGHVLAPGEPARILRGAFVNYSGNLVAGVVGLLLIPIVVRGVGAPEYGLWVAALALSTLVGAFDPGLSWAVTREVARDTRPSTETADFVRGALLVFLATGAAGGVAIAVLGLGAQAWLTFAAELQPVVAPLFAAIGVAFAGNQVTFYVLGILHGAKRFGAASLLLITGTVLRAGGILWLVGAGSGVVSLAIWTGVAAWAAALVGLAVTSQLEPAFRIGGGPIRLRAVRGHLGFGIASQLTNLGVRWVWDAPVLVLAFLSGSAALVPYHLAQKFPLAVATVPWRVAEAVFPWASSGDTSSTSTRNEQVLTLGTRYSLAVALPACALLMVVAPGLLTVWLGTTEPATVAIFRIMTVAILADAAGVSAMHVLWASGRVVTVIKVLASMAVAITLLCLAAIPPLGIVGAAWAFLLPVAAGAAAFLLSATASPACAVRVLRSAIPGVVLPTLLVTAAVSVANIAWPLRSWPALLVAGALSAMMYVAVFYWTTPHQHEKAALRTGRDALCAVLGSAAPRARKRQPSPRR
jgi:O-antigen/teichoic acid export membrane protein